MSTKRPLDEPEASTSEPKKAKHGFRVGPANLPDGPWRRKFDKKKKDLIEKAKVKKQYAKVKARQQRLDEESKQPAGTLTNPAESPGGGEDDPEPAQPQIHPERQVMLETDPAADPTTDPAAEETGEAAWAARRRPEPRRGGGGYVYGKQLAQAAQKKQEAEERAAERERREEERSRRTAERDRHRRAMAKARAPGRNGQRRLGRESFVLLDKVKRLVG